MRIKRDYLGALRRKWDWFVSRFKPLTVHTEAIMVDSVWERIRERVEKGDVAKWYIMPPSNRDYYSSCFNVKMSPKKIEEIMIGRYKWMLEKGQKLELHVHLSLIMKNMSYKEQEKLIGDSVKWFEKNLGYRPKEFVAGWWVYDENTLKVLRKFDLKMILPKDYDYAHDYEWA